MFNAGMRAAQPTNPVQKARLVLTPVGAEDVDDLILLHGDPMVAVWTGPWSRATTQAWTTHMAERWTADGVGKWLAHDRSNGSLVGRGGFTRFDLDGGRRSSGLRPSFRTCRWSPSPRCTTSRRGR